MDKGVLHTHLCYDEKNDQDGQDMVISRFELFVWCVFTFFDPGFTHCYICLSLVLLDNVKYMRLNYDVLVEISLGYHVVCNQIYRDCPFMIKSLVFPSDLIEKPFKDFDVIIRLD